jgi:hypothetical protein
MTFNGTLAGTPTVTFSGNVTFQVQDAAAATASATLALNIIAAPAVAAAALPDGEISVSYPTQTLSASGGSSGTYTWSISGGALPGGINLNPSNGQLTGTPTAAGTFNFTAKATDSATGFGTQAFSIHVIAAPVVAGAALPNGELTVAYPVQTLSATGGASATYTWSISGGALPTGITINPGNGQLTGTPTTAGMFNFTAKATDSAGGFGTQGFTITVIAGPSITTNSPLPSGTVNQAYTPTQLTAINGTAPYTWALAPGSTALPNGISLSQAGVLSGTPTSSGDFTPTVRVTDAAGAQADKQFTLSIATGLVITTAPTLPVGTLGVAYSQNLAAAGGTQPYTWSVISGQLPSGVMLAGNGTLSGTPGSAGTFDFTVQVTDTNLASTTKLFHLQIAGSLSITNSPTLPGGAVGVAYSQTLTASGGTQPYTWSITAGSLPGGLQLNAVTGAITGTPTATGSFNFTVQVADSASVKASQAFSLQISAVTITNSPTLPSGAVGVAYSQTLSASGGAAPYTWSITAGALPGGLQLSAGGSISGSPTATGTFVFTVQVADSAAVKATKQFSITIVAGLTITTAPTLPAGVSGVSYSQSLAAVGGTTPYTWSITTGSLPNGLSLNSSNGAITGTPSSNGNFNFTVQVSDAASVKSTKAFSITIAPGLTITSAPTLPSGSVGVAYTQPLSASGGSLPYQWSVSAGALPAGVALSATTGSVSGTPTSSGTFTFTVRVTDANTVSVTKQFTLTIASGLVIATPPDLPGGSVASAYAQNLTVAGGTSPYNWSVTSGSLPGGLSLNPSSGVISGTPAAAGTFSFVVQVIDSSLRSASKGFTLKIVASLAITTPANLPPGSIGAAYSQSLAAVGGLRPYTWAVIIGAPPPGLQLNTSDGSIRGTPTTGGSFTFTVELTDAASLKTSRQFTLTIGSQLLITSNAALPAATVNTSYSFTFAAAGGDSPYSWAVTGGSLPAGLSLNGVTGAITGVPTAGGSFSFTVQVTDSRNAKFSQEFTLSVGVPGLPDMSVTGLTSTAQAGQQLNFDVRLASGYSVPITGRITLSFQPDAVAPADDPAIQFSTGGRTLNFTIPANATRAVFPATQVSLGTGTVSGTIGMAFSLQAGGANLPTTGLDRSITIARSAPVIKSVDFIKSGTSFQVRVVGYSTPRELTQVHLRFTAAAGASLQTVDVTVPLSSVAGPFFANSGSAQFGGQFELLLPFTASQGSASAVGSVTVDLSSNTGTSQPVSANY